MAAAALSIEVVLRNSADNGMACACGSADGASWRTGGQECPRSRRAPGELADKNVRAPASDQMNGATGKPEEMLLRVGVKNIGYVQFCDTDSTLRDGGTSKHLGCGDGRIDCDKSLEILKQGGFRGWIMADEWEVPDPYDACLKCKRVIDAVGRS